MADSSDVLKLLFTPILLFCLAPAAAQGQQRGVTLNGTTQYGHVTLPSSAPYSAVGDFRITLRLRITNVATGANQRIWSNGSFTLYISSTGVLNLLDWSTSSGPTLSVVGRTDIIIRARRSGTLGSLEVWNPNGTNYASNSTPLEMRSGAMSWSGSNGFGADDSSGGNLLAGSVDYLRVYSSAGSLGSTPVPGESDTAGDLLNYEFTNSPNDSSANAKDLTFVGSPSYGDTPAIAVLANAGADKAIAAATGSTQLSGSVAGDYTSVAWTQISGPSTATITGGTTLTPTVSNGVVGEYTFRLTATGPGGSSTDDVEVGCVAVDSNNFIVFSDPKVEAIIGPQTLLGTSPWPYFDWQYPTLGEYFGRRLPSVSPRSNPAGTLALENGSTTVQGAGTFFTQAVTPGEIDTAVQNLASYGIPLYVQDAGGTWQTLEVASVTDDDTLVLSEPWAGTTTSGRDWATSNPTVSLSDGEEDWFQNNWNHYDPGYNLYVLYYKTGLTKYRDLARKNADARWSRWNYGNYPDLDALNGVYGAFSGLILRAHDGRPEYIYWLHLCLDHNLDKWAYLRKDYQGLYYGVRDPTYFIQWALQLAEVMPTATGYANYPNGTLAASSGTTDAATAATQKASLFSRALESAVRYHARVQAPDGSLRWDTSENLCATGCGQQYFMMGLVSQTWRQLYLTLERDGGYDTYKNTLALASIKLASQMWEGYSYDQPFTGVTGVSFLRSNIYASFDTSFTGPGNSAPRHTSFASSGTIEDIIFFRHNSNTLPHAYWFAYYLTGQEQFKDKGDNTFAALYGGSQRDASAPSGGPQTDAGMGAIEDYYLHPSSPVINHRRAKNWSETNRTAGSGLYFRAATPLSVSFPFATTGNTWYRDYSTGTTSATLTVTAKDPAGASLTYLWEVMPGSEAAATITSPTAASTTVTGLAASKYYQLRCTVSNGAKSVYVYSHVRTTGIVHGGPPSVTASDQSLAAGTTSFNLAATQTDPDGDTVRGRWVQVSGAPVTITNETAATANVTGATAGARIFRRYAWDTSLNTTAQSTAADTYVVVTIASGAGTGRGHRGRVKFKGKVSIR